MTAKERKIYDRWQSEIDVYELQQSDLSKELKYLYGTYGGPPANFMHTRIDYLLAWNEDTRRAAKNILMQYQRAEAHIEAREELKKALANEAHPA